MNVDNYLNLVAYQDDMEICGDVSKVWKSRFDDSYMTHVGMEENIKFLADREITEQLTHGLGFSPKDNKWYGWSHRAICGFSIGSTCKKGDCHYKASNEDEEIEKAINFWADNYHERTWVEDVNDGIIYIRWKYNNKVPNEKLRNTIGGITWKYNQNSYGRGEWIAKTMEDAKQMAIDFNEGVS